MTARALMLQGTGSDVGKSLLAAALCRAYARRGLTVRPFKPQNMSNNAAVAASADGRTAGEIGRAQALQARAAGAAPTVDMNPVLLKPTGETGAQVIVHGRPIAQADARGYHALKPTLLPAVLESFARLRAEADLVICEGAGGAAETNLRAGDIANMGFALAAGVPVVLVGDIERGGMLAALVGTHALLEPAERALLVGYIVNKFRGDPKLFAGAIPIVGERTGLPCLGVVPYVEDAERLPKEDSAGLRAGRRPGAPGAVRIAVPRLPRIANFDDLDPLAAEPGVALTMLEHEPVPADTDIVLLPGSKATRADLEALRARGLDHDILAHRRRGGLVVGLCGGYQMLGQRVADPHGVEGAPGETPGLGLLDVETVLAPAKTVGLAAGTDRRSGEAVRGYEIHAGETRGPDTARPMLALDGGRPDGAVSPDGRVMGGYLHGLYAADGFRRAFLAAIRDGTFAARAWEAEVEAALDALADRVAAAVDLDRLLALAR